MNDGPDPARDMEADDLSFRDDCLADHIVTAFERAISTREFDVADRLLDALRTLAFTEAWDK
jgi:hypothetical protein